MSKTFDPHPFNVTFIYPHTASTATASAYVTIKAPERGDRRQKGRNQTFARMKNGNVTVYDMGTNMSDILNLSFEMMPQAEYAAMLVFFEYVVWGANKIKYVDYKGDEYVVRIYKATLDTTNKGEADLKSNELTQYDFTLDLIDVTNNVADTGQTAVPTQLAIHLADTAHPHNPKAVTSVVAATTTVLDSTSVDAFKHTTWLVSVVTDAGYTKTILAHAVHDGTPISDAATTALSQETLVTLGTDPADITFTIDLSGVGTAQIMRLKVTKTAGSLVASVRRFKV